MIFLKYVFFKYIFTYISKWWNTAFLKPLLRYKTFVIYQQYFGELFQNGDKMGSIFLDSASTKPI